MLTLRLILVLSLMLTLIHVVMAGGGLPKPSCHSCTIRVRDCKQNCLDNHHNDKSYEFACQVACKCHIGRQNKFCRENCGLSAECQGQVGGEEVVVS